VVVYV